jgi:hypothetical protein
MEFLIRRTDGEWFDIHLSAMPDVLQPARRPSRSVTEFGDHRIEVDGVHIAFSYEDPGIQVTFEGDVDAAWARSVVEEILERIESMTGQSARIIAL